LKIFAFSSSLAASYAVSVRQASVLPAASSGFHLAMDTLAVRLTIPPAGFVRDFHPQMSAPCRAHKGTPRLLQQPGFVILLLSKPYQKLRSTESACGDDAGPAFGPAGVHFSTV
jgi:hypothetical protein